MSAEYSAAWARAGVTYAVNGGVGRIEFNRPEASNAVDLPAAVAFGDAVEAARAEASVEAVLLTGAGTRFCAGGDVAAMLEAEDRTAYVEELAASFDGALQRLTALEKPVVAGVRGAVAGAGLAVMLSCDLVVAGAGTKFVAAYSGVGLTPDCGLSWLLPRAIGQQRALELLLTNRVVGAQQAHEWGLVTEVTKDQGIGERALALATSLTGGPAAALGQTRRLVRQSWEAGRGQTGADEARTIGWAAGTSESERLMARFRQSVT